MGALQSAADSYGFIQTFVHTRDVPVKVLQTEVHVFHEVANEWKLDIVHQRRLIVMAENPQWMVEQDDYPYARLMDAARQSTGKDLPLEPSAVYRWMDDTNLAAQIQSCTADHRNNLDDAHACATHCDRRAAPKSHPTDAE